IAIGRPRISRVRMSAGAGSDECTSRRSSGRASLCPMIRSKSTSVMSLSAGLLTKGSDRAIVPGAPEWYPSVGETPQEAEGCAVTLPAAVISVLIPVRNGGDELARCLEAINGQRIDEQFE